MIRPGEATPTNLHLSSSRFQICFTIRTEFQLVPRKIVRCFAGKVPTATDLSGLCSIANHIHYRGRFPGACNIPRLVVDRLRRAKQIFSACSKCTIQPLRAHHLQPWRPVATATATAAAEPCSRCAGRARRSPGRRSWRRRPYRHFPSPW